MKSKQIIGLIIIVIGVSILLDQFTIFSGLGYVIRTYWPLLLIAFGVSLLQKGSNTAALLVLSLGFAFQISTLFDVNVFSLLLPIVIIWLGLKMLIPGSTNPTSGEQIHTFSGSDSSESRIDVLNETALFSENKKKIMSESFNGGSVTSIFSETIIDLNNVSLGSDQVTIELTSVLGSIEIIVPKHIAVITTGNPVLGEFQNRSNSEQNVDTTKKLVITGTAILGSVVIKN